MRKSTKKLDRIAKAQAVLENLAKSEVVGLTAQLVELEQRLEQAQSAFSSPTVTLVFSDLYIGHVHKLQRRCIEVRQLLDAARANLRSETIRGNRLKMNIQSVAAKEIRDREESENLERIERKLIEPARNG